MNSIRTKAVHIAIATALAAGTALAGAVAVHHAESAGHSLVTTVARPGEIIDCCE